jgi:hypothetical protein
MNSTIPADLLELKARFEIWRTNRQYLREPMPNELRSAALEMSRRYPPSLVSRVLKLDVSRLKKTVAKRLAPRTVRKQPPTAFFRLLPEATLPKVESSSSPAIADCRLQFERPDGSRLTLTLPRLDPETINRLCADFLRGSNR